ncbi:hypothetical protein ACSNOB_16655 [Micromonospora sp. URMC 106]|uniref:hypothetical protein n=1 Tax=Micromonospora sp. URMC 106 TaxID=3423408 RepID=UPI003F19F888
MWARADPQQTSQAPRDRQPVTRLVQDLLQRMRRDRSGYLAMLELRLEATRRPELRAALTSDRHGERQTILGGAARAPGR